MCIRDRLRIIDDVPSSAVELSVKEKVSKYPKGKLAILLNSTGDKVKLLQFFFYLLWPFTILCFFTLKFLKKVQRQERIVEEIKLVLKPYYNRKKINKDDYKDILRKCVPKVRTINQNRREAVLILIRKINKFLSSALKLFIYYMISYFRYATAKMVI